MSERILASVAGWLAVVAAAAWLAAGGRVEDGTVRLWAAAVMVRDVPTHLPENLSILLPQLGLLPLLAFAGLARLVPTLAPIALALLASMVAGRLLADWYRRLRSAGWSAASAGIALASLVGHPFTAWMVSRTGPEVLSLAVFAMLAASLHGLARDGTGRRVVLLGFAAALGIALDPRFVWYAPCLLPLVACLLPPGMFREGPFGPFLVLLLPLVGMLGLLAWLGWVATGDPAEMLASLGAPSLARVGEAADPRLGPYGGRTFEPALLGLAALALTIAAAVPALLRPVGGPRTRIFLVGLLAAPVVGFATATAFARIEHPFAFFALLIVAIVRALAACDGPPARRTALALLLLGGATGWGWVAHAVDPHTVGWRSALLHRPSAEPHAGERALAAFLARAPTTSLDDRLGLPVIAALGRADTLVVPPDPAFFEQILGRRPTVAQIAVPDPDRPGAAEDRLLRAFPDLWLRGPPGGSWRLVYDRSGWRVWRREEPATGSVVSGPRAVPSSAGDRLRTAS